MLNQNKVLYLQKLTVMKKVLFALMSAALVFFAGCTKPGNSEEGKWYCFEGGEQNARLYLELNSGKADLIITAWGTRYRGPYTYDAESGKLSIKYTDCKTRYVGMEAPDKCTLVSNLFNDWPGPSSADHVILDSPIEMVFTVNGDKADCKFDTIGLELEMTRK